jgi:hypothetical protein
MTLSDDEKDDSLGGQHAFHIEATVRRVNGTMGCDRDRNANMGDDMT